MVSHFNVSSSVPGTKKSADKDFQAAGEAYEVQHNLLPMEEPVHKHHMLNAHSVHEHASLNKELRKQKSPISKSKLVPTIKL